MNRLTTIAVLFIFCISFIGACNSQQPQPRGTPEYITAIRNWHQKRIERLKSPNGWLNLAGLFWLTTGENTVGADSSNTIIFPKDKAPDFVGSFILRDSVVFFQARPGVGVRHNDSTVTSILMRHDLEGDPTMLQLGNLSWTIIKRGNKFGVRLRDHEHPLLKTFEGIETFPIDSSWRIPASFEFYHPPKTISIPSVLNTINQEPSPGALVFKWHGKTYRLDTTGNLSDEELFVIFADATNGKETYGAGRFLYVPTPEASGKTIIDFNRAYNPPCAFTDYATCPLPPEQNRLPIRITAGEKNYKHSAH